MASVNLHAPFLAPATASGDHFLTYVPRTSAAIFVLAAFACFARGRGILAAISLLLAGAWQLNLAVAVIPAAALSIGLTLCDRAGSSSIRVMAAILITLAAVLLERFMPGAGYHLEIWIPSFLIVLFLFIGPMTLDPSWRATASLAAFLFLTLGFSELLAHPPAREWLDRITPVPSDPDLGLPAIRHLASLGLLLTVIIGLTNRILPLALRNDRKLRFVLLSLASLGLVVVFASSMPRWTRSARHMALLMHNEGTVRPRPRLNGKDLRALDPRQEDAFFAALGDFLLDAKAKP